MFKTTGIFTTLMLWWTASWAGYGLSTEEYGPVVIQAIVALVFILTGSKPEESSKESN